MNKILLSNLLGAPIGQIAQNSRVAPCKDAKVTVLIVSIPFKRASIGAL